MNPSVRAKPKAKSFRSVGVAIITAAVVPLRTMATCVSSGRLRKISRAPSRCTDHPAELETARQNLQRAKSELRPSTGTELQLRQFRQAYDAVPWSSMEQMLGLANIERAALAAYARYVEALATCHKNVHQAAGPSLRPP